jgi:nucleotide-binding universal stress UspA family protein
MQPALPDPPHGKPILVAYDGSRSACTALSWAVAEAASSGRALTLAHVMRWPLPEVDGLHLPASAHNAGRARQAARDLVSAAVASCRQTAPGMDIRAEALTGGAIELLTELSAKASLLVLGACGQTASPQVLLGSTASELTRRVTVPVAVIRGIADDIPDAPLAAAVVIGVDGSTASARAARAGFDLAARQNLRVLAVHAWSDLPLEALGIHAGADSAQGREDGAALLATQLAEGRRLYPQVPVEEIVALDRPTRALLDHAAGAALLVVGRHGRAGTTDTPLGSVCHAVLHYAPCPVLIIH